jgi:hypothetical protein
VITPLITYGFPELSGRREFRTVRSYAADGSLADVLSNPPGRWTLTAKAKVVVGIAFGLLHAAVQTSNIFFDAEWQIQIADFSPIHLETSEIEPFSGEGWAPTADVSAFASLVFKIARGVSVTPPTDGADCPPLYAAVPAFV